MPRGLIFLLLLAAPAVWSQTAGSPADVVARCVESAAARSYGLEELETQCSGIEQALIELGYAPFISERQLDELTIYGLGDLQRLVQRYTERPASAGDIPTDSLAPILESLDEQPRAEQPLTLFERFKRWLRETFQRRQDASDSWLSRWLDKIDVPETVTSVIVYVLIALVILLALAVLIIELRAAARGQSNGVRRKHAAAGNAPQATKELTLADLDATPPAERPSALLRILVATLVKCGRLRAERSLTHRELLARVSLDDAAQRESFGEVSKLSERTVYGNVRVAPDEIDRVVQAGRALVSQIAASTAKDAAVQGAAK